jgi:hypothetical protein
MLAEATPIVIPASLSNSVTIEKPTFLAKRQRFLLFAASFAPCLDPQPDSHPEETDPRDVP